MILFMFLISFRNPNEVGKLYWNIPVPDAQSDDNIRKGTDIITMGRRLSTRPFEHMARISRNSVRKF